SYYSDYTFGCWTETQELLPVGKAYFGFTDEELRWLDRWIRGHTVERFGPVREVEKSLVLEVAFDSIHASTRHKSGLAMRFPRISRIDNGFTAPAGAIVVDERSNTVLPGMTDVHVHLTNNSGEPWYTGFTQKRSVPYGTTVGLTHALDMARGGFTTVRDLGGDTSSVIAVRDAVAEGRFPGPRIRVSGAPLSIIGGHADEATALPPELAAAVNEAHLNSSVCTGVEE